ncbi:MAG: carotenoid biosynthesis protein [Chloroflexi bacterium]|nr:carotenoid biosynthesis protein [Chloroflexota bacterium]
MAQGFVEKVRVQTLARPARVIALSAFAVYTLGIAYTILCHVLRVPPPHWLVQFDTFAFFAFALAHATEQLGARATFVFLALTFAISFAFETVGVLTGAIYGAYYYTHRLGLKLGVVPIIIPLAWFMMMYASYTVVAIIASGTRRVSSAWLALLGALAMTAWDLGMDPQMAAAQMWVWVDGGAYFGVPIQNFIGWVATTFCIFWLFQIFAQRQSPRELKFDNAFALLPVAAYAIQGASTVAIGVMNNQPEPSLVAFFAMGAFLFSAITRVLATR